MLIEYDSPANWPANLGFTDIRILGGTTPGEYYTSVFVAGIYSLVSFVSGFTCLVMTESIAADLRKMSHWIEGKLRRNG